MDTKLVKRNFLTYLRPRLFTNIAINVNGIQFYYGFRWSSTLKSVNVQELYVYGLNDINDASETSFDSLNNNLNVLNGKFERTLTASCHRVAIIVHSVVS